MVKRRLLAAILAASCLSVHAGEPLPQQPSAEDSDSESAGVDATAGSPLTAAPQVSCSSEAARHGSSLVQTGDRGYWFYHCPPAAAPEVHVPLKPSPEPQPKSPETADEKAKRCGEQDTWSVDCGFILPKSFDMQAKERDALFPDMAMHPEDPERVKAAQKYLQWVVDQSLYVADVGKYNILNDTSLDKGAENPVSTYGLQMASRLGQVNRKMVWSALRDFGAFLVIFTKADCDYCHAQIGPLLSVKSDTNLRVYDATIQGPCLSELKDSCQPLEQSEKPAEILHVGLVPMIYLYLPGEVWIRVSSGLTDTATIEERIYNLFISWRLAAVDKMHETGKTGLDLNPNDQPKNSQALRTLINTLPFQGSNGAPAAPPPAK